MTSGPAEASAPRAIKHVSQFEFGILCSAFCNVPAPSGQRIGKQYCFFLLSLHIIGCRRSFQTCHWGFGSPLPFVGVKEVLLSNPPPNGLLPANGLLLGCSELPWRCACTLSTMQVRQAQELLVAWLSGPSAQGSRLSVGVAPHMGCCLSPAGPCPQLSAARPGVPSPLSGAGRFPGQWWCCGRPQPPR